MLKDTVDVLAISVDRANRNIGEYNNRYFNLGNYRIFGGIEAIEVALKNISMLNARLHAIEKHLGIETVEREEADKYYIKEKKNA